MSQASESLHMRNIDNNTHNAPPNHAEHFLGANDTRGGLNSTLNPAEQANVAAAAKLLREILGYQQRLKRLQNLQNGGQDYLIKAYRRSIQVRRRLLEDLPQPIDRGTPNPWQQQALVTENH